MKRIIRFSLILLLIGKNQLASAQPFTLLKDINPTTGSIPRPLASFNGWLYFSAVDGVHGRELWKSDGTSAGTVMVKDISPLSNSAFPDNMIEFNGKIYFSANDLDHGAEIWTTDGTEAGTILFMDINPGTSGSSAGTFTVYNGSLLFFANDGIHGMELWKSDGTVTGTAMYKDINVGPGSSVGHTDFTAIGNTLYFAAFDGLASDGFHGTELWKTDGTAAGTMLVKDINTSTHPLDSYSGSFPSSMINYNGILYFRANQGKDNSEVWRSDGTEDGTFLLKEINIVPSGNPGLTLSSIPENFTILNGILLFSATDGTNGIELWKTDGTETGTVMVKDIHATGGSSPTRLRVLGNCVYFAATTAANGRELWKSDGTEAGTVMVMDINPNPGADSYPWMHNVINNRLYFVANDGTNGDEMWATDGTAAGTYMVQNIAPGAESSNPNGVWESNGKLFMPSHTVTYNWEFWVADASLPIALPLRLLEFNGSLINDDGVLQWKTVNELNTTSFVVERSTDGRHYGPVGTVYAANADGIHFYNYTDVNIQSLGATIIYYRLRQVDMDNKFTWSRIVALSMDNKKNFAMLYPNPVRNEINLTITLARKEKLNWQLVDNNGHIMKTGYYDLSAGSTAVSIDVSNIPAGNYFMQLKGESLQQIIKVLKQ